MTDSVTEIMNEIKTLHASYLDDMKTFEKSLKELQALPPLPKKELKFSFTGLVKEYANAVKIGGSATTMKPSCAKAIEKASKNLTSESISAAIKALEDHASEVKKNEKGNKDAAKFISSIGKIVEKLSRLEKML